VSNPSDQTTDEPLHDQDSLQREQQDIGAGEPAAAQTPSAEEEPRYYPNRIGRAYVLALEDIMGKRGLTAVLNLDREVLFDDFAALNQALDDMYGPRGRRGLAIRAARASFSITYEDFTSVAGVAGAAFKFLPLSAQLKIGLPGMARVFTQFSDQTSWVKEEEDRFVYVIERCPVCWGRKADRPICHAAVGLLQEGMVWATGRELRIEEFECIAKGDPTCKFAIYKEPLDQAR